ncbi:hypothetical protein WN48_07026 [Eufriesea mexicana]|uniref:Uncharacterized protein n=1 Tax=Eufriesea mexicana TaxID=516756 RepID=A0A310SU87_9HYME|nr:hypothetical protein WN48_07026 [Eufriesea mexicana]
MALSYLQEAQINAGTFQPPLVNPPTSNRTPIDDCVGRVTQSRLERLFRLSTSDKRLIHKYVFR